MTNLASNSKHADVVKRMKTRLAQLVEETKQRGYLESREDLSS
jgi:hypothetical protein